MSKLQTILALFPAADSRSIQDVEEEIQDELEFHLAMRTEENIRLGMSATEARAVAVEKFGDLERIHNSCRQALLGERIMLQRLQIALITVLLLAVVMLAYQVHSTQQTMEEVGEQLARLKNAAPTDSPPEPAGSPAEWEAHRPRVVDTFPANEALDVDPSVGEIRVTFDKEMSDRSWSWVRSSPEAFPESTGDIHYLDDRKTCVMPVKLETGTKYVVWFNTSRYQNFKDRDGRPAVPYLLTFTTRQ